MDSILTSIKKLLGIEEDYKHFDPEIIMHINTVFLTLNQLGVGRDTIYSITGDLESWNDFFGSTNRIESVKTYVYLKVKMLFDPPSSSFVLESMKRQADELEWRMKVYNETN